mgnify:CR=1 FL=1
MNELYKAIIRLLVTFVLVLNAGLTAKGLNPIPFDESAVTDVLTQLFAAGSIVWSWWKNNNVTKKARAQKDISNKLKTGEVALTQAAEVEDDEPVTDLDTEYEMGDE